MELPLRPLAAAAFCLSSTGLLLLLRTLRRRLRGARCPAAEAVTKADAPRTQVGISAAQLAQLLGNLPLDEELPSANAPDARDAQVGARAASARPAPVPSARPEHCSPDGQQLLDALEGRDNRLAARLVRQADAAAVNFSDEMQRNALLLAAAEGHVEAFQVLINRDDFMGVNARSNVGATALHLAAGNDQVEICRLLLACSRFTAGVNCQTNSGHTPLDFALDFGDGDAEAVLRAAGGERRTSGNLRQRRILRDPPEAAQTEQPGDIDEEVHSMNELD